MTRRTMWRMIALALSLVLFTAACGNDDDKDTNANAGGGDTSGAKLSGAIVIDGSSTVAPLTEAIAEEFNKEQAGVNVSVGTSGTGGGFTKFCAGETDISDASRPIKDEEKAACQAKGITYKEFRIGLDGLAVVTSAKNKFLECLNYEQLKKIWVAGGSTTWNQVDPSFPAAKISIFAPDTESGTYDFFGEEVLGDPKKPETPKARTDYEASSDDNQLVRGIEGEENSWGYFGLAYYTENKGELKDIKIAEKAGGACVAPSAQTVEDNTYPLSRPLFIYVKDTAMARPEVKGFVKFYLETTPKVIADVGYVVAPDIDYKQGLDVLKAL